MQRKSIWVVLIVMVLTGAFVAGTAVIVWRMAKKTVRQEILTPKEETVDLTAVVTQVRELQRLETASMRVVNVSRITQGYKMVPDALGGDEITFLAAGDVYAGLDLSQLQQKDVWRSPDGTLNLRLPPPQILVSRVDNNESRVLVRKTGVLRRADVDLETRARQHAEANIRAEALKKGILQVAQQSGEKKMGEFLHTLGFQRVRFVNAPGPALQR